MLSEDAVVVIFILLNSIIHDVILSSNVYKLLPGEIPLYEHPVYVFDIFCVAYNFGSNVNGANDDGIFDVEIIADAMVFYSINFGHNGQNFF